MKKLLALLLALAMVFTLAACGSSKDSGKKDDKEDGIAGEYYLVSVEVNGKELKARILEKTYGEDCYIEMEEDGKATFYQLDQELDMEWEDDEIWYEGAEDEKFELDINEKKGTLTITMEVEDEETVLSFEKESDDDEDEDEDDDKKDKDEDDKKKDEDEEEEEEYGQAVERPLTTAPEEEYDYPEPSYYEEEEEHPEVAVAYYYFSYLTEDGEVYDMDRIAEEFGEETAQSYETYYIAMYSDGTAEMWDEGTCQELEYNDTEIWPEGSSEDAIEYDISGDVLTLYSGTGDEVAFERS